jgi:hypothetical protein
VNDFALIRTIKEDCYYGKETLVLFSKLFKSNNLCGCILYKEVDFKQEIE